MFTRLSLAHAAGRGACTRSASTPSTKWAVSGMMGPVKNIPPRMLLFDVASVAKYFDDDNALPTSLGSPGWRMGETGRPSTSSPENEAGRPSPARVASRLVENAATPGRVRSFSGSPETANGASHLPLAVETPWYTPDAK